MKQRIISALFGVVLFAIVLISNKIVFDVALLVIIDMAIYELISALGIGKHILMKILCMLFPIIYISGNYIVDLKPIQTIFPFLVISLIVMIFKHNDYTFNNISTYFTATVLITVSFSYIGYVRNMDNGLINVLIIFIGSWITDTCAYFSGVFFGKHKLVPKISPKKTIEGSVGGIIGTVIVMIAYTAIIPVFVHNISTNIFNATIIAIICGVISQMGDLCASIIKREHNIKDYGSIMPGHGGVMDRFDSILFVAPLVALHITYFPIFS